MKRDPEKLSRQIYDLAIIGGGIYGAHVARDAALRGLSVVLLDQGDFGNATSANSQKIIHGGLRYLQHGNLARMRESIRERRTLMRIAPHLVFPMPFLIPLYNKPFWKKAMMGMALRLNDLIGFDRNQGLSSDQIIPRGQLLSKAESLAYAPTLDGKGLSGGMLFYDGQAQNADRLTLSLLLSASELGADIVNYAEVQKFHREGDVLTGFQFKDRLSGVVSGLRSRLIVNCAGPWTRSVQALLQQDKNPPKSMLFKAVVLVTRPLFEGVAVGLSAKQHFIDQSELISKGYRYLFATPWRETSLIGTFYFPFEGSPNNFLISEAEINCAIGELNEAFSGAELKRSDVYFVYGGLLPRTDGGKNQKDIQYAKHYKIRDHEKENGIAGLISVEGVKYTTARDVAEKTLNLVLKKLGSEPVKCKTRETPVFGGNIAHFGEFVDEAIRKSEGYFSPEVVKHLIGAYGTGYLKLIADCEKDESLRQPVSDRHLVLRAEVMHAMRAEMAQKLSDVVFRRTELGTAGRPGDACLSLCADMMAKELGWDRAKRAKELAETKGLFLNMGSVA